MSRKIIISQQLPQCKPSQKGYYDPLHSSKLTQGHHVCPEAALPGCSSRGSPASGPLCAFQMCTPLCPLCQGPWEGKEGEKGSVEYVLEALWPPL